MDKMEWLVHMLFCCSSRAQISLLQLPVEDDIDLSDVEMDDILPDGGKDEL